MDCTVMYTVKKNMLSHWIFLWLGFRKTCGGKPVGAHHFDLFSTTTPLLRPFIKLGFVIGREVQVEVMFWSKYRKG